MCGSSLTTLLRIPRELACHGNCEPWKQTERKPESPCISLTETRFWGDAATNGLFRCFCPGQHSIHLHPWALQIKQCKSNRASKAVSKRCSLVFSLNSITHTEDCRIFFRSNSVVVFHFVSLSHEAGWSRLILESRHFG